MQEIVKPKEEAKVKEEPKAQEIVKPKEEAKSQRRTESARNSKA